MGYEFRITAVSFELLAFGEERGWVCGYGGGGCHKVGGFGGDSHAEFGLRVLWGVGGGGGGGGGAAGLWCMGGIQVHAT